MHLTVVANEANFTGTTISVLSVRASSSILARIGTALVQVDFTVIALQKNIANNVIAKQIYT